MRKTLYLYSLNGNLSRDKLDNAIEQLNNKGYKYFKWINKNTRKEKLYDENINND